jgi:hypothetical protein
LLTGVSPLVCEATKVQQAEPIPLECYGLLCLP